MSSEVKKVKLKIYVLMFFFLFLFQEISTEHLNLYQVVNECQVEEIDGTKVLEIEESN